MLINVPGSWQKPPVDSTQPLEFRSIPHRLRLSEQGLTALEADREKVLWEAAWSQIISIQAWQTKTPSIRLESKDAFFSLTEVRTFDEDFKYIADVANAYLKAFQGPHNAQQEERVKYGLADGILTACWVGLVLLNISLFVFMVIYGEGGLSANPQTIKSLDHLSHQIAAATFGLYLLLAFVAIPLRYFPIPRYNKRALIMTGTFFCIVPAFMSFMFATGLGDAMAMRYTLRHSTPFTATYPVKDSWLSHGRYGTSTSLLLDTGGPERLIVGGSERDHELIQPGMTLQVTGLRSPYGILVESWKNSDDSRRDIADIMKHIVENKADIVAAYDHAKRMFSNFHGGKVKFKISLARDGSVISCSILSSELVDPGLEDSIVNTIRGLNFGAINSDAPWQGVGDLNFI